MGLPWWLTSATAENAGSIPGWGRSPGEGNGIPLQYSCLGDPVDRSDWGWAHPHCVIMPALWRWQVNEKPSPSHWLKMDHIPCADDYLLLQPPGYFLVLYHGNLIVVPFLLSLAVLSSWTPFFFFLQLSSHVYCILRNFLITLTKMRFKNTFWK